MLLMCPQEVVYSQADDLRRRVVGCGKLLARERYVCRC